MTPNNQAPPTVKIGRVILNFAAVLAMEEIDNGPNAGGLTVFIPGQHLGLNQAEGEAFLFLYASYLSAAGQTILDGDERYKNREKYLAQYRAQVDAQQAAALSAVPQVALPSQPDTSASQQAEADLGGVEDLEAAIAYIRQQKQAAQSPHAAVPIPAPVNNPKVIKFPFPARAKGDPNLVQNVPAGGGQVSQTQLQAMLQRMKEEK